MATEASSAMFSLSEIHPLLKGQRIAELRPRLEGGIATLKSLLSGCSFAVFDHISEFDLDGLVTSIGAIAGFQSERDAAAFAFERVTFQVLTRLEQPGWHLQLEPARAANILPATGSRLPGKLPAQIVSAALRASRYDSYYVRGFLVQSEPDDLLDNLMSNDFLADDLVWFLDKRLGSAA